MLVVGAVFFFGLIAVLVFQDGLCCADDSYFAVAAKNLAYGHGYASSAEQSGEYGFLRFDPTITTGPTVLVPAAILIRFLGNEPWVPGLTATLVSFFLFCAIFTFQARRENFWRVCLYLLAFLSICYALTPFHFELWYALLGEVPAALLSILGMIFVARSSPRSKYVGSVLIGCAAMSKLLASLLYAPVLFWILIWTWKERGFLRATCTAIVNFILFLIPPAMFELWKLLSLGIDQLVRLEIANAKFIFASGAPDTARSDWSAKIAQHAMQFSNHFGISLWIIGTLAVVTSVAIWQSADQWAKRQATLFFSAAALHVTWWLAFSSGWPRYALIGLIVYAAGVSANVFCRAVILPVTAAVGAVLLHLSLAPGLAYPILKVHDIVMHGAERMRHLREAAAVLASLQNDRPFVSSWWGAYADLEYVLPRSLNFVRFDHASPETLSRPFILAYDKRWTDFTPLPAFDALESTCREIILAADPYYIRRCPPQASK